MERETIGWLCSYTPVEIPMAAGLLPVRLGGEGGVSRSGDPRIYHLLCPYVRAVFHRAAEEPGSRPGRVVFTRCCDAMVRLHDVWKAYLGGEADFLDLPKISTGEAVNYFASVLKGWAGRLSAKGHPMSEGALWHAISGMNRARGLFRQMFQAMAVQENHVKYSWLRARVRQWLRWPTQEILEGIRTQWEALGRGGSTTVSGAGVVLISTMLDQSALVEMLEEVGFRILAEDECLGERHFDGDVAEMGDPFAALAERYLRRWPCPRMKDTGRRLEVLDRLLERTGAKGVIALQLKFCDQSGFDLPSLQEHMASRRVPLLVIENDYGELSMGQIRTRVEAFRETLDEPWE